MQGGWDGQQCVTEYCVGDGRVSVGGEVCYTKTRLSDAISPCNVSGVSVSIHVDNKWLIKTI